MLVKCFEGSNEDATILQNATHSEVNVLQHLAAFPHCHGCRSDAADWRPIRGMKKIAPGASLSLGALYTGSTV